MFKKTKTAQTNPTAIRALSASEINAVAGGINPQPLPPAARSAARA
jgi:hypothetical protein